jgi:hypothetical protein
MARSLAGGGGLAFERKKMSQRLHAVRGQAKNIDEAWALNKCREPTAKAAASTPPLL